jgi:hypothetical protein
MRDEPYDIVGEFKKDPMLAWEFLEIHDSFPFWKKTLIKLRLALKTGLGI